MKKFIAIALSLVIAVLAFAGCSANGKSTDQPQDTDGKIDAKIILVLEDKSEVPYDIHVTDGVSVREALFEAKLISEETQTAFFVEDIDGHIAKAEDGVLWSVCDENGEMLGAIDDVTVSAGKTIKMIYTVAPNYDD